MASSGASGRGVLMVSAGFHPYVGGSEKQALELSVALKARGWRVRVLTRRLAGLPALETVRGIEVVRLWAAGTGLANSLVFMASLFLRLLREAGAFDAIHVHLAGSPALPAALAGRILGRPVIVKLGGGRGIGELAASAATFAGRLKIRLLRWLGPRFVVVTPDLRDEVAAFGLSGGKLSVIPNGVDVGVYSPAPPESRPALRKALGWPDGLGFLYVGRLSPEKRLPMFLEALAAAAMAPPGGPIRPSGAAPGAAGGPTLPAAPAFFVAFVGEGPEEAGLRDLAGRLGLPAQFHPPTDSVWKAYQAADVFVLPSVSEGLSNALLEAMACGLAVLGSRVGGAIEAVAHGASGLLFDDRQGLEEGIRRFLDEPGLAGALGSESRRRAMRFSLADVARRYEELYGEPA